jgi:hypothetical protein
MQVHETQHDVDVLVATVLAKGKSAHAYNGRAQPLTRELHHDANNGQSAGVSHQRMLVTASCHDARRSRGRVGAHGHDGMHVGIRH